MLFPGPDDTCTELPCPVRASLSLGLSSKTGWTDSPGDGAFGTVQVSTPVELGMRVFPLHKQKAERITPVSLSLNSCKNLSPLQHPFTPCINKADNQDENKYDAFDHSIQSKLAKFHSPREEKNCFHIKNQEHEREDIVLSLELYPAISNRLDTTFISVLFDGVGLLWAKNPCHPNGAYRDHQPNYDKQ